MNNGRFVKTALRVQFGEPVEIIADVLLNRGACSLVELLELTKLPLPQLKTSLLVLVQHDCVTALATTFEKKARTDTTSSSSASPSAIGTPTTPAKKAAPAPAKTAATPAKKDGNKEKTPKKEAAKKETNKKKSKKTIQVEEDSDGKTEAAAPEPTPTPAHTPTPTISTQETKKEKSKTTVAQRVVYELDIDTVRYRTRLAHYCVHAKSLFNREGELVVELLCQHGKLTENHLVDLVVARARMDQKLMDGDEKKIKEVKETTRRVLHKITTLGYIIRAQTLVTAMKRSTARKRKIKDVVEENIVSAKKKEKLQKSRTGIDVEDDDDSDAKDNYFAINHNQFLLDFRKEEIVQYVERRVDTTAAGIIHALLDAETREGTRGQVFEDAALFDVVERSNRVRSLDVDTLARSLDDMQNDNMTILTKGPRGYSINTEAILEDCRMRHAQAILNEKHGMVAGRIFRLLIIHKRLEEKQISDLATAARTKTHEVLHTLLRVGFIELTEVPRGVDRAPARTFFTWSVDVRKVNKLLLDSFYFTWANVRQRLELETAKIQPFLSKLQVHAAEPITEDEKKTIEKWKRGSDRMENALAKLDKLIMLFADY